MEDIVFDFVVDEPSVVCVECDAIPCSCGWVDQEFFQGFALRTCEHCGATIASNGMCKCFRPTPPAIECETCHWPIIQVNGGCRCKGAFRIQRIRLRTLLETGLLEPLLFKVFWVTRVFDGVEKSGVFTLSLPCVAERAYLATGAKDRFSFDWKEGDGVYEIVRQHVVLNPFSCPGKQHSGSLKQLKKRYVAVPMEEREDLQPLFFALHQNLSEKHKVYEALAKYFSCAGEHELVLYCTDLRHGVIEYGSQLERVIISIVGEWCGFVDGARQTSLKNAWCEIEKYCIVPNRDKYYEEQCSEYTKKGSILRALICKELSVVGLNALRPARRRCMMHFVPREPWSRNSWESPLELLYEAAIEAALHSVPKIRSFLQPEFQGGEITSSLPQLSDFYVVLCGVRRVQAVHNESWTKKKFAEEISRLAREDEDCEKSADDKRCLTSGIVVDHGETKRHRTREVLDDMTKMRDTMDQLQAVIERLPRQARQECMMNFKAFLLEKAGDDPNVGAFLDALRFKDRNELADLAYRYYWIGQGPLPDPGAFVAIVFGQKGLSVCQTVPPGVKIYGFSVVANCGAGLVSGLPVPYAVRDPYGLAEMEEEESVCVVWMGHAPVQVELLREQERQGLVLVASVNQSSVMGRAVQEDQMASNEVRIGCLTRAANNDSVVEGVVILGCPDSGRQQLQSQIEELKSDVDGIFSDADKLEEKMNELHLTLQETTGNQNDMQRQLDGTESEITMIQRDLNSLRLDVETQQHFVEELASLRVMVGEKRAEIGVAVGGTIDAGDGDVLIEDVGRSSVTVDEDVIGGEGVTLMNKEGEGKASSLRATNLTATKKVDVVVQLGVGNHTNLNKVKGRNITIKTGSGKE
jgi:hypothetical protein